MTRRRGAAMRMPAWLRRNAIALAALVVLVPATGAIVFGLQWADYQSMVPDRVDAVSGRQVEFGGLAWTLEQTAEFEGTGADGNGIPVGSSIVAALVTVNPTGASEQPFCEFELTQDPDAAHPDGRSWTQLASASQYRYELGEDTSTFCDDDRDGQYQLELVYLVPAGVYGHSFIDAETDSRRDRVLRFPMAP